MERGLIIILSVVFIVIWMLGKRFLKRNKTRENPATDILNQVETWYGVAQEQVALMDRSARARREEKWSALPMEERVELTDQFLTRRFGNSARDLYRADEKLRIGAVWYVGSDPDASDP